ncbi:response regulator [Streptomyces sp. NPDC126514]|uniref:response regulator n=1 Tax=Streptomyces sp. NPDC126514 TaxID=3155210 RepID=UPI00332164F4
MLGGRSVAGQVLVLQLAVVVALVAVAAVALFLRNRQDLIDETKRQSLNVAHTFARAPGTAQAMAAADPSDVLQPRARSVQQVTGADLVVVFNTAKIRYTAPDAAQIGKRILGPGNIDRPSTLTLDSSAGLSVVSVAPIPGPEGKPVGGVAVGFTIRNVDGLAARQLPALIGGAAGALVLVGAGSALLSRRLRRQTHGLGPVEITRMYEHHDAVLHAVREGVLVLGEDRRVLLANDEARRLLDLPGDAEGREAAEQSLGFGLSELLAAGRPATDEVHMVGMRLLSVSVRPTHRRGEPSGSVVTLRDTTELQKLSDKAQSAEATSRAKSTFLATMSHEIRTPLHAVMGISELLLETPLDEEQRGFVEIAHANAVSLLAIINDILDFSKIEAGKFELHRAPLSLHRCIESAFDVIAPRARQKPDLDLAYVVDPALPGEIVADEHRLRQVLVNLLGNAVKFTEAGEVVLTVTRIDAEYREGEEGAGVPAPPAARPPLQEGQSGFTVRFTVHDTGPGIPPDRMELLFSPFEQLDSSATRRFGGSGLGLAISRRLVELMDGTIWAQSEAGQGSTFHFTLPAHTAAAERTVQPAAPDALRGKRMLAVDDNPTNRRILARLAGLWGMPLWAAGSAEEALAAICDGDPFDVAVVDLQMPGTDGGALARDISSRRPELAMIVLTTTGRPEAGAEGLALFAGYHSKPIRGAQLYASLCHALLADTPQAGPASRAGERPAREALGPLRILLAEDNAVNRQLALHMLTKIGYSADAVGDGEQVLHRLRQQPYDVVLMDIHMPVMNGLEAARAIGREWPARQRPRIIALTASAMPEDRAACLDAGMHDYLSKPLTLDALAAALARCTPSPPRRE